MTTSEESWPVRRRVTYAFLVLALGAVYFVTGTLGLRLAFENINASAVWPPTGIALAALLLLGRGLWPGVWLGAFTTNLATSGSISASLAIAVGNTLEVLVGEWLVRRFARGRHAFEQARTTFAYMLCALPSAVIAATLGALALGVTRENRWEDLPSLWMTWWIGDVVSAVMLTPLIVMWAASPVPDLRSRRLEALAMFGVLVLIAVLIFGGVLPPRLAQYEYSFVSVPPLIWAAFRFGQRGAATASLVLSGVAIWGTLHGNGPFVLERPSDSLLLLQAFLATITVTTLALGAVVAELRRSAESLRRSEEQARTQNSQLRGVMEAVPAVIWIAHDPHCHVITGNPASYEMLRMPVGENASASNPERAGVPFEVRKDGRVLAAGDLPVQRAAAGETIRGFEEEVRFADGTSRHLYGNATPLRDDEGRLRGAVAAFVDISERKQAEQRLGANLAIAQLLIATRDAGVAMSAVLQTICEALAWPVGAIWTPSADGQTLRCKDFWRDPSTNVTQFEAFSRATAFSPGVGLPGRVWQSLAPVWIPDVTKDSNFPRAPYASAEGLHAAFGFPVISNGRCMAVIEFFNREIREPDRKMLAMFAGVGAQIGQYLERGRAEEELRTSQVQLQLITDCMSAPVSRCTRDLRYAWVSKPYCDWCGLPAEKIVGRPIAEVMGQAAFERLLPFFERVLSGETVRYEEQVDVRGRGRRWISAVYSPTFDASGRTDGWVAIVLDIDQRKRTEEALRETDRRKDEFLAILAHELRNPLAPIRNSLALLERLSPPDSALDGPRSVIDRQVGQLERLLDDLLDVSRISSGKLKLLRERIRLGDALAGAVESNRGLIEARKHKLELDIAADPIMVNGDMVRLTQVFANLLQNAAKYTQDGGNIRLRAQRRGDEAVVCVSDDGIGIPSDKLDQIFEIFMQVDSALERSSGGLGIGLTLVKRLIEMHGGQVRVRSDGSSRGSEFTVHLPLSAVTARENRMKRDASGRDGRGGLRVLIADDNPDAAFTLSQLLELLGHTTRLAHDGIAALEAISVFDPDAAILDIGMPGLNGYDVARRVRSGQTGRRVFLVALTGWGQESDRLLAREAGFDAHLTKPARIEAIEELLSSARPAP